MNGTKLQRIGILLLILFAIGATAWNMWGNNINSVELDIESQGKGKVTIEPQKEKYKVGEKIKLVAIPEKGWKFVEWSGDINKKENTIDIEVKENMTIKPIFEEEKFTIKIEKTGEGNISINPDKEFFNNDETITIEAQPDEGWEFVKWGNNIDSNNKRIELTIEKNMTINPLFEKKQFSLNINIEGEGNYKLEPDKEKYEYEEEVTVTAEPAEGWKFIEWEGDIQSGHKSADIKINKDTTISAIFEKKEYSLNTQIEGDGSVKIEPDKEKYEYEEEVTVTAEPAEGWKFIEWTGDIKSEHSSADVKITKDMKISPIFEKREYELSIETQGKGRLKIEPDKEKYDYKEEVTVTAEPAEGWEFIEWKGDIQSEHKTVDIKITEDMSIEPLFEQKQYKIDVSKEGQGNIKINPDKEYYNYGDKVTLKAEPKQGWKFIQWSGDINKQNNSLEIEITNNINIKSIFESKKYTININTEGKGKVTIEPDKEQYNYNEEIIITPAPTEGWDFIKWTGDINSKETPLKINIKKDINITSLFRNPDNIVKFKDKRLEEIIRQKIDQPEGELYLNMVSDIKKIEASGMSIKSLEGIGSLKSLEYLDLSRKWVEGTWNYNFISDLKPLSNLENLNYLDLSGNNIEDITPLIQNKGLTKDDYIKLTNNNLNLAEGSETMKNIEKLKSRGIKVEY